MSPGVKGAIAGAKHWNWRGGRSQPKGRHILVHAPGHPRAHKNYVREHILIAERALGKPLPPKAVVHHANEVKDDNANSNLVILQSQGEHAALHSRLRTWRAGGNPWVERLCGNCGTVKPLAEFRQSPRRRHPWCSNCVLLTDRRRYNRTPMSERHGSSKLTVEQVLAIRAAAASGEKQADLARSYGVSKFVINDIVWRRKWKSV